MKSVKVAGFPEMSTFNSLPEGNTSGETFSYLFITYHSVWSGFYSNSSSLSKIEWEKNIPHSRTSLFPCEFMQSISVMFGNVWKVVDFLHIRMMHTSLLVSDRCKCTCWHKYHTFNSQGQCVSSFASSELLLLSPDAKRTCGRLLRQNFHAFTCKSCRIDLCKCIYIYI